MRINILSKSFCFKSLQNAAAEILSNYINCDCELSLEIEFFSKRKIRALNNRLRQINSATDVLSFPFFENLKEGGTESLKSMPNLQEILIGSIAICKKIAKKQAKQYGHSFLREVNYLAAHGILHLFGYDHEQEKDKEIMRKIEEEIMATIGLKR